MGRCHVPDLRSVAIEAGIKDSDQGRTTDVSEVRKRFGLTS